SGPTHAWPPVSPFGEPGLRPSELNRYPNAPVMAPFANLPPPATEARPPSTAFDTTLAAKFCPLMNGAAAEVIPPARAAGPHLPRDATAEAQPTRACPATFSMYLSGLMNGFGLCVVNSPTS